MDYNCPAWREGGVVLDVEIGGLEGDPTKNGRDVEGEAIGQVADVVSHGEDIFDILGIFWGVTRPLYRVADF